MSNGKEDDSVGSWSKHNRHINELQHLRQAVQVPTKYPSATLTRADSDIRKRTKTADTSHKKSKSFFDGSPYMTASPQPLESETAESSFIPKRDPTVKRRARSASSVGPSPTPSTSSSRVSSIDNPSFSLSMDKNKSWLQEDTGSEQTNVSPSSDRGSGKRTTKDSRRKDGDKENRKPSGSNQAPLKVIHSTSTDILDKVSKGDIFRLTEMTTSRSDTSRKPSSSKHGSITRSSKQRKPSEQVIIASKLLRFPIERRYSIMVDMIGEGEIYNPLEVIRHRNVREKKIDADSNFSDDRYIRILDPWYVSSDELIAHYNWRKEQIIQHQMSVKVEEIDSNIDIQMKEALPAGLNTETNTFDKSVLSDEERSSGLLPTMTSPHRKDFISPSPSLSPVSTPPRSPNIHTYFDSVYGNDEEDDGKEFVEKRRSWSNPFSRKDKGKSKGKLDADLQAKRKHRNDELMHHYQITPLTAAGSTLHTASTNQSNNSLPENLTIGGQTLLVPVERHTRSPGRHRRSLSTFDVPTLSSHRLTTPEAQASGESTAELSSEDTQSRLSFRSRRHSFDNLQSSSKGSHRHFSIWSDKHRKRKKVSLHSDSEQNDGGAESKWRFRHILNNSDTESESNESDFKDHGRSRRRDLRNLLKQETELTSKTHSRPSSQSPPFEEAAKRETTPDVISTGASLAARVALQEQKLREMALYSDQEDDTDIQSVTDLTSGALQRSLSDEGERVSPRLTSDEPISATYKVYLNSTDLPAEVQAMVQQYEVMNRVQIVPAGTKQAVEESSEKENSHSILTADADADTEITTISETETEEASIDKTSEDKSDDDEGDSGKATDGNLIVIEASKNDDVQFTKLLNVDLDLPSASGILVDLHVSMLGDVDQDYNRLEPVLEDNIQLLNTELEKSKSLATEAKAFYEQHRQTIQELVLDEALEYGDLGLSSSLSSNGSFGALYLDKHNIIGDKSNNEKFTSTGTSSPISVTPSPNRSMAGSYAEFDGHSLQRAPSLLLNNVPYRSVSPFDYRQEEVRLGINALRGEMDQFQQALHETENLIKGIQTDMNNTSERIPTILHDIPENDYSMLKKLEVEVDSILANRAKSPWLDTGYALLSYVLAYTAFFVWVIIRVFKWIRAVVVFPRTLWTTYSEYLVERDKAVKRASLQAVTSGFDKVPFESSDSGRRHHRQHRRRRSSGIDIPKPSYTI